MPGPVVGSLGDLIIRAKVTASIPFVRRLVEARLGIGHFARRVLAALARPGPA